MKTTQEIRDALLDAHSCILAIELYHQHMDEILQALTEKYGEEEAKNGLHFSWNDIANNFDIFFKWIPRRTHDR